jgi:hypothetical protein
MMATAVQLPEALRALVDCRLDTIDRILVGRVPRQERLAIVREVESQIHEVLQERGGDEPTREDVLGILARLDPPEAYLGDDLGVAPASVSARPAAPLTPVARRPSDQSKLAGASGILGILAMVAIVLFPLGYGGGFALKNEFVILFIWGLASLLMFVCGLLALIFGIRARKSGGWALTGIVTGCSALAGLLLACGLLIALILSEIG